MEPPRKKVRRDSRDPIDLVPSVLCGSVFCQLLAAFNVPKTGTGLVKALNDHFKSNRPLSPALPTDNPYFHLGTMKQIVARQHCPFCRIATSAINIDSHPTGDEPIHVYWAEAYGKFDLATISESGKPKRAILRLGVRITFCEEDDRSEATIQWGRTTNIHHFDPNQVKGWLSLCESDHKVGEKRCWPTAAEISTRPNSPHSHEFRLIDVREQCVVSRPWQSRYLALTYVWGKVNQPRLEKGSIASLNAPGSLRKLDDQIPKTIRDAIGFVGMIGEQYLWVDSLCLVQDDDKLMKEGIQSMNFVYQNALATIVAADGSDAEVGLRRLHWTLDRKTQSVHTIKPGFRLMALGAMEVYLKRSKWNSRAWTFQEQILSRRMIVFVNRQVYYHCRRCIWSEDTCADKFPNETLTDEWSVTCISYMAASRPGMGDIEDDPVPFAALINMLEYYCERELTIESDAINAVSGILHVISTMMKSIVLQGLQVLALDYMILFQVRACKRMETCGTFGEVRRRKSFPSWTWAGWEAPCSWHSYPDNPPMETQRFNHWLDHGTWIVWYKSSGSEVPEMILEVESRKILFRNAEEEVSYSRTSQPDLSGRFGKLDTSRTVPTILASISPAYLEQDLLRFYTVTVTLTISLRIPNRIPWPEDKEDNGTGMDVKDVEPSAALYDSEGSFAGLLVYDVTEFPAEDGEYELAILSDSQKSLFHRMDLPDSPNSNPFVSYHDNGQDWRLFWVWLLVWNEGVAERQGIGQILRSSVKMSFPPGPQWKEIMLG